MFDPDKTADDLRTHAVLTVRNEGAFLLEWLAHHRGIGFTDFLVFSNDCQDGTDVILDHLAQRGWLTHIRNEGPYGTRGVQFNALNQAGQHAVVQSTDWLVALDIDEFVNIHVGDHTLAALYAAVPDATAVTLTWRLFGNAGKDRFTDTPITETFTRCAPEVMYWPWRAAMFKSLYRNDGTYQKMGVHRPRSPKPDKVAHARWYDGNGKELGDNFRKSRIFSNYGRPNFGMVQLNHYPLGSLESYILKADRGRAVHSGEQLGADYWVERNFNTDTDTSIQNAAPLSAPFMADFANDTILTDLHNRAVQWRRNRFEELMELEPYRALYARLLMAPPSRPITRPEARILTSYAVKGQSNSKGS